MKKTLLTFLIVIVAHNASAISCASTLSVRRDQGQITIEGAHNGEPVFLKYYRDGGRKSVTGNVGNEEISYSQWYDGGRFNSSGTISDVAIKILGRKGFSIGQNRSGLSTRNEGGRLIVEGVYGGREVFIVRYKDGGRTYYHGWVDNEDDEFSYSEWRDGGRLNSRGTLWTEWTNPMRSLGYSIDGR